MGPLKSHTTPYGGKAIGSHPGQWRQLGTVNQNYQGPWQHLELLWVWPAVRRQHLLPQGRGNPGGLRHLAGLGSPEAKLPHSFQIGSKALPGPTHTPTHAGREGGDSESSGQPYPTAGDLVITTTASVRENLRIGEPSELRGSGRSQRASHSILIGA